ncbi:hypothetical protein [Roseiconus lacunae]|uniref:hypothetical protein n=1 Tax=Roseiconus lacunae TaxID=2605694 RepID=UPI001E5FC56B|nr:hypothetical protein [Roseiconus lacunae]MCD0457934.1 hypothetical protein [Roseiconus lacunae]
MKHTLALGSSRIVPEQLASRCSCRYGYDEKPSDRLIEKLDSARSQEQWNDIVELANALVMLADRASA